MNKVRRSLPPKQTFDGLGNLDGCEALAAWAEDMHDLSGEVQVAFLVERHAVCAHRRSQFAVCQGAVRLDAVHVGFAVAGIGHIEQLAVCRTDNAVGLDQVVQHADQLLAVRRQVVDVEAVLFQAVLSPVAGIGEIDAALRGDPQPFDLGAWRNQFIGRQETCRSAHQHEHEYDGFD